MDQQTMAGATAEYSTFEGLFVRGLKVDKAFEAELRKVGVDLSRPEPRYPAKMWRASLDLAQRRYFSELSREDGRRALGRAAFDGFLATLSGKFLAAALSTVVSPPALLKRLPRFFQLARPGIEVVMTQVSDRCWRGVWKDPEPDPYFVSGLVEGGGRRTTSSFRAELDQVNPDGFELLFRWD